MTPDDQRHGTYAGALAHWRFDGNLCGDCRVAARRHRKLAGMRRLRGIEGHVSLGQRAWGTLDAAGCTQLAKLTGLGRNNLYRMHRLGPDARVLRSTRAKILAASPPTNVGIQRRLQALAAIGHTAMAVAVIAGVHPEPLGRLRRRATPPITVKSHVAAGICRSYDELAMKPAPVTRVSSKCRSIAEREGWLPPMAWDDIDDPDAKPQMGGNEQVYDDVLVDRLLAGELLKSNRAEKLEAMRRWLASGGSEAELCRIHGWKTDRYTPARAAA